MPKGEIGIGELSRLTGVNIETIRYYEKVGLLTSPPRTQGGHRFYQELHRTRLVFIRRGRELGFKVEEVRNLLGLVDGDKTCWEIRDVAVGHLADIRDRIADLRRMERTLATTVELCEGGTAPNCPIVDVLSRDDCRNAKVGRR